MDGAEDKHVSPSREEPRWLTFLRDLRTAFDLIYIPVVGLGMLVGLPWFLTHPELLTREGWTAVTSLLLGAGGVGLLRRRSG